MKTKETIPSLRPALLATLILVSISCIALFNPEIAQGKVSVKALKPIINHLLADTGHKATVKNTAHLHAHAAKKATHATQHNSSNDEDSYTDNNEDKKLAALNAEVQKHAQALTQYYKSEAFKETQQQLEQNGKNIQDFYNRPELKKLQEELSKASSNYSKNFGEDDKIKAITTQMGEKGRKISAYYNTPEFKKMNNELKKEYGIPDNYYYDDRDIKDENYKKYQAELDTRIPADVKLTQAELSQMGEQVSSHYQSPEFKAQNRRIQVLGDSLKDAYNAPEVKEKQKEMDRLSKQMNGYQNNPEIKREQELLDQSVKKLTAYVHSAEYRKYIRSKMNFSFDFNYDNGDEIPEKADKPEKPERPEKPEKPESPESDDN